LEPGLALGYEAGITTLSQRWPKPRTLIEADGPLLMDAGFEAQHGLADCTSFVLDRSQQSLR